MKWLQLIAYSKHTQIPVWACVALLLMIRCTADPDTGLYRLQLVDAAGPGIALEILAELHVDKVQQAIAVIPDAGMKPHPANAEGFEINGDSLKAVFRIDVRPDHWFPRDGRSRSGLVRIDALVQDGTIAGVYSSTVFDGARNGSLHGSVTATGHHCPSARYEVVLDHAMDSTGDRWDNRAFIDFTLDSGRICASRIYSENNTTYAIFTSRVLSTSVFSEKDSLAIGFASLTRGAFGNGKFDFYLMGRHLGDYYYGNYITVKEGDTVAADAFLGRLEPLSNHPDPRNALLHVQLYDVLPKRYGNEAMWLHFNSRDGQLNRGIAFAPRYNHEGHHADGSALKNNAGHLTGSVAVVLIPDPYAKDTEDTTKCVFHIDAGITKDALRGVCYGQVGAVEVQGAVTGQIGHPLPDPSHYRVQLKMEEGVTGAEPWFNRTYINLYIADNAIAEGSFSNNKEGWEGSFEGGSWHYENSRFTAQLHGAVLSGKPRAGVYSYRMEGFAVGDVMIGDYTSWYRGDHLDTRRVVGTIERNAERRQ